MQTHSDNEQPFMTSREMLSDMHSKVNQMYNVVYGDEKAGILGAGQRIKKLEEADKKRTSIYMLISAVSAGVAVGFKSFIDHFK